MVTQNRRVVIGIRKLALEWLRKLSTVNGFDSLECYLVHAVLDHLRESLDFDEDHETRARLAMLSMFEEGLLEIFQAHNVDLPIDDYFGELLKQPNLK